MNNQRSFFNQLKINTNFKVGLLVEWLSMEIRYLTLTNSLTVFRWFSFVMIMIFVPYTWASAVSLINTTIIDNLSFLIISIFLLLIILILFITFCILSFSKSYIKMKQSNGKPIFIKGAPINVQIIFDDKVIKVLLNMPNNSNDKTIHYHQIRYVLLYDNLVMIPKSLWSNKYQLIFYKDQLNCSWEEFESFIREKNPKVKIRSAKLFRK